MRTPDGALHISGEVIECAPHRKLTFTFDVNWPELIEKLGATLVTYDIEPAGDAVRLTMTESHDRPLDDDILSGGRQGWPAILSSLKSLLETGDAPHRQDGAAGANAGGAEETSASRRHSICVFLPRKKQGGHHRQPIYSRSGQIACCNNATDDMHVTRRAVSRDVIMGRDDRRY